VEDAIGINKDEHAPARMARSEIPAKSGGVAREAGWATERHNLRRKTSVIRTQYAGAVVVTIFD